MLLALLCLLASAAGGAAASPPPNARPCAPSHPASAYPFCDASLSVPARARALVSLLTLDEKIAQLSNTAGGVPRLGIPPYQWWSESLHGLADNGPGVNFSSGPVRAATAFPQVILSTAAFNRSLWRAVAEAVATEALGMHNAGQAGLTYWAPNINIFRDPRWGRGQETSGEDPAVAAAYSLEYVKGFQGEEGEEGRIRLSACCKHYTAYDMEKWEGFTRYTFNAKVNAQDLEDTYQPPFKTCIQEARASCLMCAYNQVNGVPMCAHKDLLQKTRDEWGFQGYITSDCDAVAIIHENQTYTKSDEDSVAIVLKAGVPCNPITFHQGIQPYVAQTTFAAGCKDVSCNSTYLFGEAIEAAKVADTVIVVAGLNLTEEREDLDRVSLLLPGNQMGLIHTIASVTKKPLVLVLLGGGPVDVSFAKRDPRIASILWLGYPGEVGGQVLPEILFGEYNPGGKLAMTWYPESFTAIPMTDMNMRADPSRGYPGRTYRFYIGDVVYGFGYGLSYSKYSYSILSAPKKISVSHTSVPNIISRKPAYTRKDGLYFVKTEDIASCEALMFSVRIAVSNHGEMDGSHAVLLFSRLESSVPGFPIKQLVGFERVRTTAGSATNVEITVDPCKHMSAANSEGKRILLLGAHVLTVGDEEFELLIET
nr:unnamed protein product [Digitaria exilis]